MIGDQRVSPNVAGEGGQAQAGGGDWSMTGEHPPAWNAPDESVELHGRNLVLLVKALVLAAKEGWPTVAMGTLGKAGV